MDLYTRVNICTFVCLFIIPVFSHLLFMLCEVCSLFLHKYLKQKSWMHILSGLWTVFLFPMCSLTQFLPSLISLIISWFAAPYYAVILNPGSFSSCLSGLLVAMHRVCISHCGLSPEFLAVVAPGFFCWGCWRGAQEFRGGAKKLIKLWENNERLTLAICFYVQQLWKKHI